MLKRINKILMLIALLFVANSSIAMAKSLDCYMRIGDEYVRVTIYSNDITIKIGPPNIATFSPPWAVVTPEGDVLDASGSEYGSAEILLLGKKISLFAEANVRFSDASGVTINSKQPLSVSIYDVTGRLIYNATEQTDLQISTELLNDNSYYILQLTDEEGNVSSCNFILSNGALLHSPVK